MRGRAGLSVFAEKLSDVDGCANHRRQRMGLQQYFAQLLCLSADLKQQIPANYWRSYCHFYKSAQA
jgi:hypothetical protein